MSDQPARLTLTYTIDDDGVHLQCDQHGDLGTFGLDPTVEEAAAAAAAHRREHHPGERPSQLAADVAAKLRGDHRDCPAGGDGHCALGRISTDDVQEVIDLAMPEADWLPPPGPDRAP